MSSTNSSDQLTLLSYATFNNHIPIHDHSWRQHQWKQTETMVALASFHLRIWIQVCYTFLSVCVFPGNWTHNLCAADAMLYHWATGTLALQSAKKLFQKGNLETNRVILTLSGAELHARSVGVDSYTYWGLYRFFSEHFLRQWNLTTVSLAQMEGVYGDSCVH